MNKQKFLLSIFLVAGLFLLLFQLDIKSMWCDEVFTANMASHNTTYILANIASDNHPPLHYLILNLWTKIVGESDFALRFISIIFGFFSLIFVYLLGKEIFDRNIALIATGLMTISPFFILYSRMARFYSLALFLSLVSTWILFKLFKSANRKFWIGYVLASTLMLYTVYTTIFVLAGHFVLAIINHRKSREFLIRYSYTLILIAILYFPWLHTLRGQPIVRGAFGYPPLFTGLSALILRIGYPLYCFSVGETIYYYSPLGIFGFLFVFSLFVFGFWKLRGNKDRFFRFSIFFFSPFVLIVLFGTIFNSYIINMNSKLMFCLPFYYLGVTYGLISIKNIRFKVIVLIIIILLSSYSLTNYYTNSEFHNPAYVRPTKEVVGEVMGLSHLGDIIVTYTPEIYYLERSGGGDRYLYHLDEVERERVREHIRESEFQRVWIIFVKSPLSTEHERLVNDFQDFLLTNQYILNYTKEYDPLFGRYHIIAPTFQYKEIIIGYSRK